jgi:hypothetical protein
MTTYRQPYEEHPQNFNVWAKVLNPNKVLPQMTSDPLQPRFFFGGSQVPSSLEGHIGGEGIRHYKHKEDFVGTGIKKQLLRETPELNKQYTSIQKHHNIMLPKNLKR